MKEKEIKEKEIFIFDIDGTLTESKMPLTPDMARTLRTLSSAKKVALISGATFEQMTAQIVQKMCDFDDDDRAGLVADGAADAGNRGFEADSAGEVLADNFDFLKNMYLLPTSGACMYSYAGASVDVIDEEAMGVAGIRDAADALGTADISRIAQDVTKRDVWKEEYAEYFSKEEKDLIIGAVNQAIESGLYQKPERAFGEIVEDRGSQVTFSGLGQNAPYELKKTWDPDMKIRLKLVEFLRERIPQFELKIGGSTSIDIVRSGINKAFGVTRLLEQLALPIEKAVFFGDALFEGGNDHSVISTGVQCVSVSSYHDTVEVLSEMIAN